MDYKFENTEEAVQFGRLSTTKDRENLHKAITVFHTKYDHIKKNLPRTVQNFNLRAQLATWSGFCFIALESWHGIEEKKENKE